MRKTTKFTFFKNTPLIRFSATIHFKSDQQRDSHFLAKNLYPKIEYSDENFNFIRDRGRVKIPAPYQDVQGVNYCTFLSEFEPETRYYAYVTEYEYVNDGVTALNLLIDPVMTFCQGKKLNELQNLDVKRQHLTKASYEAMLPELRKNSDVLKVSSLSYTYEKGMFFDDFYMMIQSACNLQADFGTEDAPRIETSAGTTFDGVTSPVDLYLVNEKDFENLMIQLYKFPWITQNFLQVSKIPKGFIRESDLINVTPTSFSFSGLKRPVKGSYSVRNESLYYDLDMTFPELLALFGIDESEAHLIRSNYITIEFHTFGGNSLFLDPGDLDTSIGIRLETESVFGYENCLIFYPAFCGLNRWIRKNNIDNKQIGKYIQNGIVFNNFDKIPVLIDQQGLTRAMNSYNRELEEKRQRRGIITGLIGVASGILTGGMTLASSGIMSGALALSMSSAQSISSLMINNNDYWESRKAEELTLSLQRDGYTPALQTHALQQASGNYGITLKFSMPERDEWELIRNYYKGRGFQMDRTHDFLDDVESMSEMNFVQFGGEWFIPDIDVNLNKMLHGIFEEGIELWHDNGKANPISHRLIEQNRRIV